MQTTVLQNLAQRLLVSRTEPMEVNGNNDNNATLTPASINNPNTPPPPPYPVDSDSDSEDDEDEGANDSGNEHGGGTTSRRPCQPPIKLMINAAHHVQGSGNVLPVSPNPLVDAARLSMTLATALGRIGGAQPVGSAAAPGATTADPNSAIHQLQTRGLDITINCGVTVVGDRNMIGAVGIRKPVAPGNSPAPGTATTGPGPNIAAPAQAVDNSRSVPQLNSVVPTLQTNGDNGLQAVGTKRKAEDTGNTNCESPTKKVAGDSE